MTLKKLSDLRPCDRCGGHVVGGEHGPFFNMVRQSMVFVSPIDASRVLGVLASMGGDMRAIKIAETLAPAADVVRVLADEPGSGFVWAEAIVCQCCMINDPVLVEFSTWLQSVVEKRQLAEEKRRAAPTETPG